jgi:hypothetical protein
MGHYPASPTGGTGPLRPIATFSTAEPGWAEHAIECLLNYEDVVVDHVLIEGCKLNPKTPVWAQMRRLLAKHGVRTPVLPPGDEEWEWGRR